MLYFISLMLILAGGVSYELMEKTVPKKENPYLYLILTYSAALSCLIIILVVSGYNFNNLLKDLNLESIIVGVSAMIVDYGLLLSYRKGWKLSTLNITYTLFVLVIILSIDVIFLHAQVTLIDIIGILLCVCAVLLMNHKSPKRARRR